MTLCVVKLNNMKSFLLIKMNIYMYIVSCCIIVGKHNCCTQAFRQMSVQASCGCPLVKENSLNLFFTLFG